MFTNDKNDAMKTLLEEVEKMNGNLPEKLVCNTDTVLADVVAEFKFDTARHAQEIFQIWKESSDRDAVEQMFRTFTGMEFRDYLTKCRDTLAEQQKSERKGFCECMTQISEILDNHMWHFVTDEPKRHRNRYWSIEISTTPPGGMNFSRLVWFDGSVDDFILDIRQFADSFDSDEHAASYIPMRGLDGIPARIRSILDDADIIKSRLIGLASDLESWNANRN